MQENTEDNSINNLENQEIDETQEIDKTQEIDGSQEIDEPRAPAKELVTVRPVKFEEFENEGIVPVIKKNLDIMQDIIMHVSVEIGKTKSSIREVMELKQGSIIELDKIAGEQVEIYVNQKLVARGEVIVIEDKFGVRVTTTSLPKISED